MVAALLGILASVKVLIKYGASPYKRDGNGLTALQHAILKNEYEVVRYLVTEVRVPIDQPGLREGTALHLAAHHGLFEIVKLLVSRGANVNARTVDNATPIALAIMGAGSRELVDYLISRGADRREVDRVNIGINVHGADRFKSILCGYDEGDDRLLRPYPATWAPPVVAPPHLHLHLHHLPLFLPLQLQ
jgi:ankyrin repeat protein